MAGASGRGSFPSNRAPRLGAAAHRRQAADGGRSSGDPSPAAPVEPLLCIRTCVREKMREERIREERRREIREERERKKKEKRG
jgi:hypothetical protein